MNTNRSRTRAATALLAFSALVAGLLSPLPATAAETTADDTLASAPESQAKTVVETAGADVLTVGITEEGSLDLRTRTADDSLVFPADSLLFVPSTEPVTATISAAEAVLPDGYAYEGPIVLALVSASGPEGSSVKAADAQDGSVLFDTSGDTGQILDLESGAERATTWTFGATGRYTLEFQASATVLDDSGTSTTLATDAVSYTFTVGGVATETTISLEAPQAVEAGAEIPLTATISPSTAEGAVEFYDGDALLGAVALADGSAGLDASGLADGAHSLTARFVPTWSTDYTESASPAAAVVVGGAAATAAAERTVVEDSSTTDDVSVGQDDVAAGEEEQEDSASAASTADAEVRVLSSGDVRISHRLVDGDVELGVMEVSEGGAEWIDAGNAVLSVPLQDAEWPGEKYSSARAKKLWSAIAAEGTKLWRTAGDSELDEAYKTNDLVLGLDAGLLSAGDLAASPQVAFAGVTGQEDAAAPGDFVAYKTNSSDATAKVLWDGRIDAALNESQDAALAATADAAPVEEATTVGFSFTAEGIYCVALRTSAKTNAGTSLSDTAVYTVVVGESIDPETVTPCAQPETEAGGESDTNHVRDDGVSVFIEGDVRIGAVRDEDGYRLELLDATGTETETIDPAQAILAIPTQDSVWPGEKYTSGSGSRTSWARLAAEGTLLWRTAGSASLRDQYRSNGLQLALDGSLVGWEDIVGEDATVTLQSVTSDGEGYFTSYITSSSDGPLESGIGFPIWDSRDGATSASFTLAESSSTLGWAFTESGVYCVTTSSAYQNPETGTQTTAATFTVVVGGIDVDAVEPCAQQEYQDSTGDADDELDPTVHYMTSGHTDLSVTNVDGKVEWRVGKTTQYLVDDVVWVGNTSYNTFTVPAASSTADYTFIGAAGSTYYGFTESGSSSQTLWPGFSSERPAGVDGTYTWTLTGMSGPEGGDFLLFQTSAATEGREDTVLFNTKTGLRSWEKPDGTHSHVNWAFTEAGVYCLSFEIAGYIDGVYSSDTQQLTVAVGPDIDLSEVQPCGRSGDEVPAFEDTTITETDAGATVQDDGQVLVTPYLEDGALRVSAGVQDAPGDQIVYQDIEDVIFSSRASRSSGWVVGNYSNGGLQPDISWDSLELERSGLKGEPTVSLGEVEGPGELTVTRTVWNGQPVVLGTRSDDPDSTSLYAGWHERHVAYTFSASGVYCVPMTWSATLADGSTTSVTKTLTFVVGSTTASSSSYVDRSTVTPCADGGEASDPGTGSEDEDDSDDEREAVWDVENGTVNDEGATILNDGHVDIASLLEDGALDTKIKDTTVSSDAVWRDPARTVLQILPDAEATVPDSDAYSFLGSAGTEFWQVTETQQNGLLWPGWSTESIDAAATQSGVIWQLTDVSGPGEFALYTSSATDLGGVDIRFNTRDGVTDADSFEIPKETHAHGTWAFSAEGTYCLAFSRSAVLADGSAVSDDFTLAIAVGKTDVMSIDPADCFTEPDGEPEDPDTTPTVPGDLDDDNAGSVQVLGNGSGFTAGQLVTVQIGKERAGEWVSLWLDGQTWLGWLQVSSSGAVQVRLPATSAVGAHTLQVKDRDGGLLGWDSLSIVAATTPDDDGGSGGSPTDEEPAAEPDAVWEVGNGTVNNAGATVLNNGHIDIASLLDGQSLTTKVKDTTQSSTAVWRDTDETVLQLLPNSRTTVPKGSQWSFLGSAGSSFYQVSQTQQAGLLWPGWSTESIATSATKTGVDWTLTDISGPGEFALYETGAFGDPTVLFSTRDGVTDDDSFTIPKNTHAHGSWAFSAQGNYCLAFDRTTTLSSGKTVTTSFVLAVAVGRADVMNVDPSSCFTADEGTPADDTAAPKDDDLTGDTAGSVRVLDGTDGFTAGQLISLQVDKAHASSWISAWLQPDEAWLGWAKSDADGIVRVRLPANAKPGTHRIALKDADGNLIGWASIRIVVANDTGTADGGTADGDASGTVDADGVWDVANGTVNGKGATVLTAGHVDIASTLDDASLDTKIKDTTATSDPVWRDPEKTVLQVRPEARTTVPDNSAYSFLGATGSSFYQVTQVQQDGLLWPGWSTESIAADATTGGVEWTLTDLSGPGEFALYETDSFGQPSVLFNTRDGVTDADSFTIPKITHAHGSWAFSAEGTYCLAMQRTTQLSSGRTVSDSFVLAIAVGTADVMQLDPATCGEDVDTGAVDVAAPGADATDSVPAAQAIAAQQCVAGATVLSSGHIDYSSRIVDGKLQSLVGDDTSGTKVYREPSGTILWLKPSSAVTLPSGYGSVGSAGSTVWQIPQTQQSGLIWVGWSTESLNAGNAASTVSWTINSVSGPGTVKVYLTGSFGGVQQMVFDNGGSYQVPLGVHAHANWAFSAEGVYRIGTTQTVTLANGQTSSDTETLTIVVGNVDPATAAATSGSGCGTVSNALLLSDDTEGTLLAADQAAADAADAAAGVRPGQASDVGEQGFLDPFTALAQGDPVPLLLSILGALLVVGGLGFGALWWRRRRTAQA